LGDDQDDGEDCNDRSGIDNDGDEDEDEDDKDDDNDDNDEGDPSGSNAVIISSTRTPDVESSHPVSKAFQQHGEEVLKRLSGQQSSEEVPQQIRELREAIFDCIFGDGEEDDGFPGGPDEQNEHITARVLAMKALKGFRFDKEMEGWWNKVREAARGGG
jgi:hypothetical protein